MYKLPEYLSVHVVADEKEKMISSLDNMGPEEMKVYVDASETSDIDAAGLQLLLSFYLTLKKEGKEFILQNPSDTLQRMLELSGAAYYLCEGGQ
ncbi:STAS domain-containing protein [Natranaerofaba carboxydovora]|uniref:STAS domain-containing protein n=1 Tax=Natranaerofaba carboxydovora TaxID=2742683 RepID=UPI001F143509|nr:STAS domain-containing protein [Natranaerofaba carboxydovora]UMZ75061.1 STAS domain protein [Natranaerofaba carboxydovora]